MNRPMRNNNPLNIRRNKRNKWKGTVLIPTDNDFEQFTSMVYGFRAAIVLMTNYITNHRCNTIEDIVRRWAPPNENNTEMYIRRVVFMTGIGGRENIRPCRNQMERIIWAMAQIECGEQIRTHRADLDEAFALAFE